MPKKSNTKRADGRIAVQVFIGREDGKRKYKTVYGKTQKEAEKKAVELRKQLENGIILSNSMAFDFWAEKFLKYKTGKISAGWLDILSLRMQYFIKRLGKKSIPAIRLCDIQDIIDDIAKVNPYTGKPSAKKTLKGYCGAISQCFDYFVANKLILSNPLKMLQISKDAPEKKRNAITAKQKEWILKTEHRAKLPAMLMMYAGLRRGEVSALTWSDIDFVNKSITINKSYDFVKREIKSTKTAAGVRQVPIPDVLLEYLATVPRDNILVVHNTENKNMTESNWQKLWTAYMNALNLKYGNFIEPPKTNRKVPIIIETFTAHQLRHAYATMLYDAGVDVVSAKNFMGHTDIKTTLQIYTDLSDEHKKESVNKINDFLSQKQNASQNASQKSENA